MGFGLYLQGWNGKKGRGKVNGGVYILLGGRIGRMDVMDVMDSMDRQAAGRNREGTASKSTDKQ